jgi:hypothetical protein
MRSVFGKVGVLALAAAAASAMVVGCSSQNDKQAKNIKGGEPNSAITLNLQPVSGVQVNQVSYNVTQGAAAVKSGVLPTPGTASSFSFGVPLPVGSGYNISLSAVSADGSHTCVGGAGPFDVLANQSTSLQLTLTCTNITTGQISTSVDVVTDSCPRLIVDYVVATPHTAKVPDGTIAVLSQATDLDGKPVTYQWSVESPIGTFAPPNAQNTTFNCATPGNEVLVTVTAGNGECTTSLSTAISCVSETCGNGVLDPGEDCDPVIDGPTCPSDCTVACGDGNVEFGEQCEPPNTAFCTSTCQNRPIACGDGFFQPPTEMCDPTATPTGAPPGVTCQADCTFQAPAVCGDGIVQAGETCDVPGGHNFSINDCGADCNPITAAACLTCELANPECASVTNCMDVVGTATEGPAAGTPRSHLCNETLDCMRDTNCAVGQLIDCYCGTATSAQCDAGQGNGACRTQIERGLETTSPVEITNRFTRDDLGAGFAILRVGCDQAFCAAQCFQ